MANTKHAETKASGTEANAAESAPITKMEAVRRALAEGKVSTSDGVAFVKATFGIDMTPKHFSTYQSKLRLGGRKSKKRRKPGPKPVAAARKGSAAPTPVVTRDSRIALDALRQVQALCDAYGADTVKKLVDLLGQ